MNRPVHAVAALLRWRAFGESRAMDAVARHAHAARQAATHVDAAERVLDAIAEHRLHLLQAPAMDLARLEAAGAIEQAADERLRMRAHALDLARIRQAEAQQRHLAARAQVRVAEARHQRMAAAADAYRERRMFDWMADLHASRRSTP